VQVELLEERREESGVTPSFFDSGTNSELTGKFGVTPSFFGANDKRGSDPSEKKTMKRDPIRIFILALAIAGSVNASPPENDTHFRTQTFMVELPGMWKQLPSNETFAFVRGADTVFISSLDTQTKFQWRGGKATAAWLTEIRRKALDDAAQGKITFTPRRGMLKDGREMYYFSGLDLLNKKRFYVAVVGLPEVLVSMTLYRSMAEPSAGFEELFTGIMWSVRSPAG
jgi:hypothetical protein